MQARSLPALGQSYREVSVATWEAEVFGSRRHSAQVAMEWRSHRRPNPGRQRIVAPNPGKNRVKCDELTIIWPLPVGAECVAFATQEWLTKADFRHFRHRLVTIAQQGQGFPTASSDCNFDEPNSNRLRLVHTVESPPALLASQRASKPAGRKTRMTVRRLGQACTDFQ